MDTATDEMCKVYECLRAFLDVTDIQAEIASSITAYNPRQVLPTADDLMDLYGYDAQAM